MQLYIINGSPGVGKSSLSRRLHQKIESSYRLDVDEVRRNISNYAQHSTVSHNLAFSISLKIVEECLSSGTDVILDKMMYPSHDQVSGEFVLESFKKLGHKYNANITEFFFFADEETVLSRLEERGYPETGRNTPEKAIQHLKEMISYMDTRSDVIKIDTSSITQDELLDSVLEHIDT